jgi:hypothetical protein
MDLSQYQKILRSFIYTQGDRESDNFNMTFSAIPNELLTGIDLSFIEKFE